MPTIIRIDGEFAVEESTYVITCDFIDDEGQPVIPKTAKWTLTDESGNIINSRVDVEITSLAATVYIVLKAADLALSAGFSGVSQNRVLTIESTYDSTHGPDFPLNDQVLFPVVNLAANLAATS